MSENFQIRSLERRNWKRLSVGVDDVEKLSQPSSLPLQTETRPSSEDGETLSSAQSKLVLLRSMRMNMTGVRVTDIGEELFNELRADDYKEIEALGSAPDAITTKVEHESSGQLLVCKVYETTGRLLIRKIIVREILAMHKTESRYILPCREVFVRNKDGIVLLLENMDLGSLQKICQEYGPLPLEILGKAAEAIIGGLDHLYTEHGIIHRNLKPSNILLNSSGQIKISDFGTTTELTSGMVMDWPTSSSTYVPENILGSPYTIKCDIWSAGICIYTFATDKDPFLEESGLSTILDFITRVVQSVPPRLPQSGGFPVAVCGLVAKCLTADVEQRPGPRELFENDPFIAEARQSAVDLPREMIRSLFES